MSPCPSFSSSQSCEPPPPKASIHIISCKHIHSVGAAFMDTHGCRDCPNKLFSLLGFTVGSVSANSGGVLGELWLSRQSHTFTDTFWRTCFIMCFILVHRCLCVCSMSLQLQLNWHSCAAPSEGPDLHVTVRPIQRFRISACICPQRKVWSCN